MERDAFENTSIGGRFNEEEALEEEIISSSSSTGGRS